MNFIRRFNINCIRNISRLTSEALLKKHIIQPVYISKQIAYRKNSSYVSSVSTDPDAKLARDEQISDEIIGKINTHIKEKTHGRLFAIIHLHENRYKITNEDIIAVDAYFPANIGDKICLEKILLVGCSDFTLLGRPLLQHFKFFTSSVCEHQTGVFVLRGNPGIPWILNFDTRKFRGSSFKRK
ncbi:39S ribosomal protein L21, mitochondrial-like isoform X2 [Argiope bruennichi]|uniref:39S ribosomal protein L21, mitochondrial-like isoform X2 n=1 Tax=Argiope bruennichi TaxID=94029 RepID=UPI00249481B0|nr:39S ribosomal protein L21, mitochondrial-like isoform X2 [Argiope bruennichi]